MGSGSGWSSREKTLRLNRCDLGALFTAQIEVEMLQKIHLKNNVE